jgi:hypothetical protein
MSNIIEIADKVLVLGQPETDVATPITGDDAPMPDNGMIEDVSFAIPEALNLIVGFFDMAKEDLYDSDILMKIRTIYKISERSDLPLDEFLGEVAIKLGGRFTPDFLDKAYTYLTILADEFTAESKLSLLKRERELYENISNT